MTAWSSPDTPASAPCIRLCDTGVAEPLQKRLMTAFFQTADWMRNQPQA
jgi:hypothetical protein